MFCVAACMYAQLAMMLWAMLDGEMLAALPWVWLLHARVSDKLKYSGACTAS